MTAADGDDEIMLKNMFLYFGDLNMSVTFTPKLIYNYLL